ncbi:MAG: SIMPL domain-containing protein [Treponema sp.]|nr:SIMPL domain-containing protein [Treponema sp.]
MLKKISSILIIAGALILASSCTINKPKTEERIRTITVSGTGVVTLPADQLTVRFLVRTSEWNVNLARDKNAEATTKVIAKIKESGVLDGDVTTVDYRISQDNSNSYPGKYTVVNYVQVLIRDINNAGNIIDNAVANGANGLTSFTYSATENPNSVREARTLAVQNAQDAAALIAGASGCKIADVLDIQEGYNSSSYSRSTNGSAKLLMADSGYSTPIEAGTVSVSSTVTITFSLAN